MSWIYSLSDVENSKKKTKKNKQEKQKIDFKCAHPYPALLGKCEWDPFITHTDLQLSANL